MKILKSRGEAEDLHGTQKPRKQTKKEKRNRFTLTISPFPQASIPPRLIVCTAQFGSLADRTSWPYIAPSRAPPGQGNKSLALLSAGYILQLCQTRKPSQRQQETQVSNPNQPLKNPRRQNPFLKCADSKDTRITKNQANVTSLKKTQSSSNWVYELSDKK